MLFLLLLILVCILLLASYRKKQKKLLLQQTAQQDIAVFWNQLAPKVETNALPQQAARKKLRSSNNPAIGNVALGQNEVEDMFDEANRKHMFEDEQ